MLLYDYGLFLLDAWLLFQILLSQVIIQLVTINRCGANRVPKVMEMVNGDMEEWSNLISDDDDYNDGDGAKKEAMRKG